MRKKRHILEKALPASALYILLQFLQNQSADLLQALQNLLFLCCPCPFHQSPGSVFLLYFHPPVPVFFVLQQLQAHDNCLWGIPIASSPDKSYRQKVRLSPDKFLFPGGSVLPDHLLPADFPVRLRHILHFYCFLLITSHPVSVLLL